MLDKIIVKGARVHNLKNVSLEIPKNKLSVFTGISGSGKSSLAFDTIYAEGQRRYVESLSSYARQFLGVMDKPDVDSIEGLSPAISVDQKTTSHNPRSTVGTITEIYDYLRLLFARIGHPHCPNCLREISRQTVDQIVEATLVLIENLLAAKSSGDIRFMILAPVVRDRKGEFTKLFDNLRSKGFTLARVDKAFYFLNDDLILIKTNKHSVDCVIDKISINKKSFKNSKTELKKRISEAVETSLSLSQGLTIISEIQDVGFTFPEKPKKYQDHLFSERFSCPYCNISISELEPRIFSFNSPHGACLECSGIGMLLKVDPALIINSNLTISEGGVIPYARFLFSDTWFARIFNTVIAKIGIDPRVRLNMLAPDKMKKLLFGTGETEYEVIGRNRYGREVSIFETWQGVVKDLENRYSESQSDIVRNEVAKYLRQEICPICNGKRLKKESLGITVLDSSIADITAKSIISTVDWLINAENKINSRELQIAKLIFKEIRSRLSFLISVGLDYLTLDRSANSLAGGESQRIRLASQLGTGLSGVLYVLDEPSIGLHQRDNLKLINTLKQLRDLGNTVIVVEHDKEMMEASDMIYDFGPAAGEHGGKIIASGTVTEIKENPSSITGLYLSNKKVIKRRTNLKLTAETSNKFLKLFGAGENNLNSVSLKIPLNKLVCVTGVSGSGKSTLVVDTLYQHLAHHFNPYHHEKLGKLDRIEGLENVNRVILIDQSPIGRTPRSNPATYTGAFTFIRDLFSQTIDARARGYKPGRFSFNIKGGRCEVCEGDGQTKIEMQFLPDVYVTCDVCTGARYNSETLEVKFKDKNISEILNMTVEEALIFFENIPSLHDKLRTLNLVGLSYLKLGQPAPHLSGGEAQRVKLASELSKRNQKSTVFILDEPTTGLHFADLEKLLQVLHQLVELGNTVIVIEHNLDIIKNCDWIIDLGPEGGEGGGKVIAEGSPHELALVNSSYTGQFLKRLL